METLKKYSVKIPENIKIIYVNDKDLITFIGPVGKKSLQLKLKLWVDTSENMLYVLKTSSVAFSGSQKKTLNSLQGTITALLKQKILEVSVTLYKKLELVGVGYRVFSLENDLSSILHFKLGFSHPIYYKVNSDMKALCSKSTNLYIFGNSFNQITQTASSIRSYKLPEPYKGKGILYQNEKIKLKEGKKV